MRSRPWHVLGVVGVCAPALASAQAAPERVPTALSVIGCAEPSPVALMEVLKFEANLRAARAGEVERHVLVVRCETARYVVTLAAPGRAPHSRRELDPEYIPAGSASRALALTIAEMLDEQVRWRARAVVAARRALGAGVVAGEGASRARQIGRAEASRARGLALSRVPSPPAHTLLVGVSGDGVVSAPGAHIGVALGYTWAPERAWGLDLGARASAGALAPDRVSSARLEARAGVARVVDLEGLEWSVGLGFGAGAHRLEPVGARARAVQWAWRLGPVASARLRTRFTDALGVALGATAGYSLATYGAWDDGARLARVGPVWGAVFMGATLSL
jgi:hypothetical protein